MPFFVRSILLLTFMPALCGDLPSLSLPAALVASITIANRRTIQLEQGRSVNKRLPVLCLAFCDSLALILGLGMLLAFAACFAGLWMSVCLAVRCCIWLAVLLLHISVRSPLAVGLSSLWRLAMRATNASYADAEFLTFRFVYRLNLTNQTLYT